ncbi:MAG: hypothetical protein DI628_04955 [Blastochloris viridis]|uniref:Globin-sensor domain-containing protein n=1 Tax=Blastochloris viridis TaxID=1079 RepID=A0A6N4R5R4_BLAVI|nr:MAG: hypothetical protein DI628_04955 [Blastochloris viridis]
MTFTLDLTARAAYLRLATPSTAADMRRIWPLIETPLDAILDRFYRHIGAQPELAPMLKGRDIGRIKNAQFEHWKGIFLNGFDRDYETRVTRIGIAHAKIGLGPRWFFGAYCLTRAADSLFSRTSPSPARRCHPANPGISAGGVYGHGRYLCGV